MPLNSWGQLFCESYQQPENFKKYKTEYQRKLVELSNQKAIAAQADVTLSKLIASKSPIITSWLSKRGLLGQSENKIVLAWREYYFSNFILSKYPNSEKAVDQVVENFVDNQLKNNFTDDYKKKLENLFSNAKALAKNKIATWNLKEKAQMDSRIDSIKLYWPANLKKAKNKEIPLDIINWTIAYDPVPNEINIGLNSMGYPNDETYLTVFLHEIGHSIDSCRWGAFFEGKWPFEKVADCLRSEKSVFAKKRDDTQMDQLIKSGKLTSDLAMSLKLNPTCNKMIYPPAGVQADQLPEAFADWFAAEVIAQSKDIDLKKIRLDLCDPGETLQTSSYPDNTSRLKKIYFAQKTILEKTKATGEFKYCEFR